MAKGYIVPPLENHVPLVLTAYCFVFLKDCPKLDQMTHFRFYRNRLRWLKGGFLQNFKPKTMYKWPQFRYFMKLPILK